MLGPVWFLWKPRLEVDELEKSKMPDHFLACKVGGTARLYILYVRTCVCMYVWMYVHTYKYTFIHTCIHVYYT